MDSIESKIRLEAVHAVAQLRAEWKAAVPAALNLPDSYDRSDLVNVCRFGNMEDLKALIAQGADIHENHEHALLCAAENGRTEIVRYLLDLGSDIHIFHDTALLWAAGDGRTETVRLLLDRGADIHTNDDYPLKEAAKGGYMETVCLLIGHGAPLEKLTDEQRQAYENYLTELHVFKEPLTGIFNASIWAGHVPEMVEVWNMIPELLQTNFDFQSVLAQTRSHTLKSSKPRITLVK